MNAEFNWWLLIVGLVLGAALTWLVMAESTRRDADVTDAEQRGEALWIASTLTSAGRQTESDRVEEILRLHREYLGAPPPDDPAEATTASPADLEPEPEAAVPKAAVDPGDVAAATPVEDVPGDRVADAAGEVGAADPRVADDAAVDAPAKDRV